MFLFQLTKIHRFYIARFEMEFSGSAVVWGRLRNSMCAQTTQINRLHNDRKVIPLEASFETMVIEAFGMDETAASIQEASWKIKWTLDRIDLALERMNETKYTVQLDDKSVLEVNDLHRELISDQKLALEEYKLEQKELFPNTIKT